MKIIYLIMLIVILPITYGYTEVQYSYDNTTWLNATETMDNEITIEILDNGIDECTNYYFRLRHVYENYSSNFTYIDERTICGGYSQMSYFAAFLPLGFAFFFIYLLSFVPKDKAGQRISYMMLSFLCIVGSAITCFTVATEQSSSGLAQVFRGFSIGLSLFSAGMFIRIMTFFIKRFIIHKKNHEFDSLVRVK